MRNSTRSGMPKTITSKDENSSNNAENSGKKLKQARLPFKVITPSTSPVGTKTTRTTAAIKDRNDGTYSTEVRKRKLSYETSDDSANIIKEGGNISNVNVKVTTAVSKRKKIIPVSNNDTTTDLIVTILDDDDDDKKDVKGNSEELKNASVTSSTGNDDLNIKSPHATVKDKQKGARTPQTLSAQKDKNGSATKLQIKLPLSAGKKKRKKSVHLPNKSSLTDDSPNNLTGELSSDDIEEVAFKLNPQKRKKINNEYDETKCTVDRKEELEVITSDLEQEENVKNEPCDVAKSALPLPGKDTLKYEVTNKSFERGSENRVVGKDENLNESSNLTSSPNSKSNVFEKAPENDDVKSIHISDSSDEFGKRKDDEESLKESAQSDDDADDETYNLARKSSDVIENSKSKLKNSKQSLKNDENLVFSTKNLTQKQVKLMEQRRRAREEKERRLQEERIKKQQEKEEKEMAKKRDREEKEEQKRKEREEKEEQRRKEREERERKRLADIEAKNEEKRKKNEAKEEEIRKKEEERKRKELEKEEAELKKKKAAQAFTKFFVAKTPTNVQLKSEEDSNTGDGSKLLAFRPFQIKGDMKLAPICRKNLTTEEIARLDDLLALNNEANVVKNDHEDDEEIVLRKPLPNSQLYLSELRSGRIMPGKWRRPSTESKDDVIFLEDDLDRVGQAIVEDIPSYVRDEMRVKFYKFHDNRRPPYYGTWRKKSLVVKPRRPFAQDKKIFDYEVDSDDEWEEEEPGESLEDGSDDDKEKESEDDDYEVDNEWFVPHGHLSEEELQNEDEFGMGDDNTREAQKAKLKILQQEFAQEMKKKTEKIKPRLIGCIWTDINGNQPPGCAKILWDTLEKKAMLFVDPPLIEQPDADRLADPNSPTGAANSNPDKLKPISLSDNMVKDLTRLIHGNNHAKNFLINEYIAYVEKTEHSVKNGDLRKPLKSVVRDKIDEIAEWQAVNATASSIQEMELENGESNDKKKKKVKRRLCWVVKQEMLDKMDLSALKLRNSWKYTLPPKFVRTDKDAASDETAVTLTSEKILISAEQNANGKKSDKPQKKKLTQISTSNEKAKLIKNRNSSNEIHSTDKCSSETKSNACATTKEKKRVPLLMSVARGQEISTPAKNKLISQFLQQKNKGGIKPLSPTTSRISNVLTSPDVEDDDVVILD